MDEPKRFTIRWRDGMYRVSDPTLPDEVHAYRADDPAIVEALAIASAAREAGLVKEESTMSEADDHISEWLMDLSRDPLAPWNEPDDDAPGFEPDYDESHDRAAEDDE